MKRILYSFLLLPLLFAVQSLQAQNISTVAGNGADSYSGDGGPATVAQISSPYGLAVDGSSNIYFSDVNNNHIRKINASGIMSNFAGDGVYNYSGDGGPATAAEMSYPPDVAIDASGNIYIADEGNNVVRKVSAAGIISTIAGNGTSGYSGDGSAATAAELNYPVGVAVDAAGNVYIADQYNNVIRKVTASTGKISTIAGNGTPGYTGDGSAATSAEIEYPYGVAVDGSGNVYISDYDNSVIRKVNGSGIISTYAGSSSGGPGYTGDGGAATAAEINSPILIRTDGSNNLYIADYGNSVVRKVTASTGKISTIAGNGTQGFSGDGGAATSAELFLPLGVAIDATGNVYISDGSNNRIRKVNTSGVISTIGGGEGNGNPATAISAAPVGVVVDGSGNMYVADADNNRIFKINGSGITSTIAGNGTPGYSGDGSAASAGQLAAPSGIAIDGSGNVYIADQYNNVVRKVTASSGLISTIAGNGTPGYVADGGAATATEINYPSGVAVDGSGNVYIADQGNNRIRKVNGSGIISTIAGTGTGGYTSDGISAVSSEINSPSSVILDGSGNIYIADTYNNRVRKVNGSGIISTIAGNGTAGYTGDGFAATTAEIDSAVDVTVDGSGNIYIADANNNVTRKVTPAGIISTLAGNGISAFSGDGGPATAAQLANPSGVATDANQNVYVADYDNFRVRKVTTLLSPITGTMTVCMGATTTLTDITTGGTWSSGVTTIATVSGGVVTGAGAGTATITYTALGKTTTATVTVNPLPAAGTITGATSVCAGATAILTDATAGGVWSSGSTTIATVAGGTVTGVTGGTASISYTYTNTCGSATATKTITVNPLAIPGTITGATAVCAGATITLTDAAAGGAWSSTNTTATVTGGTVTGVTAGTATISYAVTNTCGTLAATYTITINPLPAAGTITGTSSVCQGVTTTLTDAATGGVWSSSNTSATVSGGVVFGVSAGVDTISYAVTVTCGTATASKAVTINPLPASGTITGAATVCAGATITLTDAATGGVWSSSNTNATVSGGAVTGVTAGFATISYAVTVACGTATVTKAITISPLPVVAAITGASAVCTGSTITLTDATSAGVWGSSNTNATVAAGVVTGASAGTDTIKYSVTNSCGTTTSTKTITVNPVPAAITGTTHVCTGSATTLSDAGGGNWSASNTTLATAGTGTGIVTGVAAGNLTVTYTLSTGCAATTPVTVNPLPNAGSISGPGSVCTSTSISLTDIAAGGIWSSSNTTASIAGGTVTGNVNGTDTISYTVTNSCGTAIATKTITITNVATAGAITIPSSICMGSTVTLADGTPGGTWASSVTTIATIETSGIVTPVSPGNSVINYTVHNSCGTATATTTITVNALPVAGTITGITAVVCASSAITLTDATTGGVWSSSNTNATVSGGAVSGVSAGTVIINYAVTNVCTTVTATKTVTVNPLPVAGTITGLSSVCVGSAITLTDATTGGTWSSSNTTAIVAGGLVTGKVAGMDTISYAVTNSCGTATITNTVTINPLPAAGTITGASVVCAAAAITLTDTTSGGAWSSSNTNAAVAAGVITGVSAGVDTIKYSVTVTCGTASITKTITINPLPVAGTITGASSVCAGSAIILSDAKAGGVWSNSNTTATVSGGVVTGRSAGVDTISYAVTNSCGTATATSTVTINALPSAIAGTTSVCAGLTTTLSDLVAGGAWSSPDLTVGIGTATGLVTGVTAGTATITYALPTGCSALASVTVDPLPVIYTVMGTAAYCAGDTGVHVTMSSSDAGISYQLYKDLSLTGAAHTGTGLLLDFGLDTAAGTYTVVATNSVTGCTSNMAGSAVITVNPLPAAVTGIKNVCAGSTITLSDITAGGAWSSSNTALAIAGTGSGIITGVAAGSPVMIYTLPTGCKTRDTITVNPLPFPITGSTHVCAGLTTTLSDGGGGVWSSSNTAVATAGSGSGVVTGLAAGTPTITYTLATGCKMTKPITVNPTPAAIGGTTNVCVNATTDLSDVLAGGAWSTANSTIATIVAGTGIVSGVSAGTASVTYILPSGCSATGDVVVNPLPEAGTITGASTVCSDSTITLSDAVTGGVWISNTSIATVTVKGVVSGVSVGTDTVIYTVTNICGTDSATWVVSVFNCHEGYVPEVLTAAGALKVYPNPNEGAFTVKLLSTYDEQVMITVTNMVGEKVKEIIAATNSAVDVRLNVTAGVYLLSGTTAHGKYVAKVTVD